MEELSVLVVHPEDASTALQAARSANASIVELRANAEGMIEVTVSRSAEAEVRKALTASKVLRAKTIDRKVEARRLTEVRPRRPG